MDRSISWSQEKETEIKICMLVAKTMTLVGQTQSSTDNQLLSIIRNTLTHMLQSRHRSIFCPLDIGIFLPCSVWLTIQNQVVHFVMLWLAWNEDEKSGSYLLSIFYGQSYFIIGQSKHFLDFLTPAYVNSRKWRVTRRKTIYGLSHQNIYFCFWSSESPVELVNRR